MVAAGSKSTDSVQMEESVVAVEEDVSATGNILLYIHVGTIIYIYICICAPIALDCRGHIMRL